MDKAIISFYYFFHGILFFQVIIFLYLYSISRKKELLYFGLFLLLLGINLVLNSTDLYGMTDRAAFMYSPVYNFVNTPLVILANICYVLFLNSFYKGITQYQLLFTILRKVKEVLWAALALFVVLFFFNIISNLLFNILHLLGIVVGVWLAIIVYRDELPFKKFVVAAFVSNLMGTFLTICMLLLQNTNTQHILVREYPYIFLQVGLLFEILFFNLALLSKWLRLEREAAIAELKSELKVEKLKNQISKALHDDIGSTLSGINMYSHMAKQQAAQGKNLAADKTLDVIQHAAGEMIYKLKDMIWEMQPDSGSIARVTDKIQDYALFITGAKSIDLQTNFSEEINRVQIPAEEKHHIYTIAKEALNNAVKYSCATRIVIEATSSKKVFTLCISDNGVGFDKQETTEGNGLVNMQARAAEMNALLQITTGHGRGTKICLQIKI